MASSSWLTHRLNPANPVICRLSPLGTVKCLIASEAQGSVCGLASGEMVPHSRGSTV